MNSSIYQILISLFAGLEKAASPFNRKIKLGQQGRMQTLAGLDNARQIVGQKPVAWFHAASLGEFEQGRPVIEAFRDRYPHYFILLTFFSPSGYEVRKDYRGADYVCYLPVDKQIYVEKFLDAFQPRIAFFIKYEFWYNYIFGLKKRGGYVISFSSIFRPGTVFFKPYGGLHRKMLGAIDHLFVQNQQSVDLLQSVDIEHCTIAGDTRFDRVAAIAGQARELPEIKQFAGERKCLVAGSVWEADMKVLIPALREIAGLKAIIAPHEIHREQIAEWKNALGSKTILYSEIAKNPDLTKFDYLIIDNIGMLSSLYRYGHFAYIGGAFGAGLHNILEAATFGLPVVFGDKSYHRFQEAVDLLEKGSAVAVADTGALQQTLKTWLSDETQRSSLGQQNRAYVQQHVGATGTIMRQVEKVLG